mmetsp:Transcript_40196/g.113823  ORF Transcript_40196/g.113823 Transcript_40196/m.113823 type:complete len:136 (-) Transcript_40196:348-755(-)
MAHPPSSSMWDMFTVLLSTCCSCCLKETAAGGRVVDVVIGTDLAYESVFFSKLLSSLLELCGEGSRWILGQRHRREFSEDLIHMISEHFDLEKTVPARDIDSQFATVSKPIFIFFFRRKASKGSHDTPKDIANNE